MEEKIPTPGRHPLVLRNPGDPLWPDRAPVLGQRAYCQRKINFVFNDSRTSMTPMFTS